MPRSPRQLPGQPTCPALITSTTIVFLTGQAWDHPEISYSIVADGAVPEVAHAVVHRAIQNWNDALAASATRRLRDFRLVRSAGEHAPDIEIQLRGGTRADDGSTEIVSGADGTIVRATMCLGWPARDAPADLDVLGTIALRGLGRALGLESASDPADPMYPAFNGVKLQPSTWDVWAFAAVEEWYVGNSPFFYPPGGYTFC